MKQILQFNRFMVMLVAMLTLSVTSAWGATTPTVLFHETFGNNTGSARAWNNSYSVKSGVASVYSGVTGYTITNAKQSKNTLGSTQSALTQTTAGTDAVFIVGPLSVATYTTLAVSYQWKAASIKGTYSTKLYYATSSTGAYTEVSGSGNGATTYVKRSYSLPAAAQVATLYLKVVFNTSNTSALIDEFELTGISSAAQTTVTLTAGDNGSVKAYSDSERQTELTLDANNQFKVDQSSTVYFTATPTTGFEVNSWTGATADAQDKTKASLEVGTDDSKTVSVSFTTSSTPTLSVNPSTISFDPVEAGTASVEGKDITVTMAYIEEVLIGFSSNSPFQVDKASLTASGKVTVTPTAATLKTAGDYADNLTITDGTLEKTVAVSIKINEPEVGVGFEQEWSAYTDWTYNNFASKQTGTITAHKGTYYGTTGGSSTGYMTTKNKVNPDSIKFFVSKQSGNTTSSSWKIQVSSDKSTWNDVKTVSATSMAQGTWVEVKEDLSKYTNVYVSIKYDGSTAIRNIDDVILTTRELAQSVVYKADDIINGTIAAATTAGDITFGTTTVTEGTTVTLSNEPASGYKLKAYSVYKTGDQLTTVDVDDDEFTMPNYAVTVNAEFELAKVLDSVTITKTADTTVFYKNEKFNATGLELTAHFSTGAEVVEPDSFVGYNMSTVGDYTVKVYYSEGATTKYAEYGISVKSAVNTKETAYTTAEVKALIDRNVPEIKTDSVFLQGVVSKVDTFFAQYSSITYWLDNNTFQIYSGKGMNGAAFTSKGDVSVDAEVVVKGIIKKYKGTYEMDYSNYLVAYTAPEKEPAEIKFTSYYKNTLAANDPADVVTFSYNGDGVLSASSTNEATATVEVTVTATDTFITVTPKAAGTTTITISAPATATYTSASKAYNLTITKAWNAASLPFSYDGNGSNINPEDGMKASGVGNYDNSPKIKFDDTGDYVIVKIAEKAVQLSYSIKGAPGSGDWAGQFDVLESKDGVDFDTLKSYTAMAKTVSYDTVAPATDSRFFKFILTNKSNGNVGLGKINIIATLPKQDPQFSIANVVVEKEDMQALDITTNSTGAITYVISPDNEGIEIEDGVVYAYAVGSYSVTANMAADDNYNAASTTFTVTVKDEEFAFKTITSFALEAGYLEMFQYKAFKGNSITEPAVYSEVLRIYKPGTSETTGGYITLTALPGYKIRGVEMPITKSANTVGYAVDGGEAPTSGTAVSKGESYKLTGIECNSVSLYNMGTDRIDISSIIIYYSGELETVSTLAVAGATKTEYELGETVNHTGAVVTATFATSGAFDVTLNSTWTDPDMTTSGTKQVTANFAGKTATYDITVKAVALSKIELSGEYQTKFNMGDAFNHDNLVVTATFTNDSVSDVTAKATVSEPDMTTAGAKTINVSYTENEVTKNASYQILVKSTAIATDTVSFGDYFTADAGLTTLEAASFTATFAQGTQVGKQANTPPAYYNNDKTGRVYNGNTFKITATRPIYMIRFVTKKFDAAFNVEAASSFNESAQSGTIIFDGTSNEVTMTAAGTVQMYNFIVYYTDQHETFRSNLAVDQVGSGCQAKSILAVRGGAFYTVESGNTQTVTLKEITEFPIAAGQPAIFKAESNKVEIIYGTKTATKAVESEEDGLVGLLSGPDQLIDEGNILVSGGRLRLVGADCYLTAGHAYISSEELEGLTPNPSAPGRRLVLTREGTTGMMNVNANENANGKFIMDGQMFILRDGKMFNAQGQLVK